MVHPITTQKGWNAFIGFHLKKRGIQLLLSLWERKAEQQRSEGSAKILDVFLREWLRHTGHESLGELDPSGVWLFVSMSSPLVFHSSRFSGTPSPCNPKCLGDPNLPQNTEIENEGGQN